MKIYISCILVCSFLLQGCSDSTERSVEYLESAKSYYTKEDYSAAKLEFRNALQIDNKLADAYYHLALIDEKEKNWQGMFSNLAQTIKLNQNNVDARLKIAKLYILSEDLENAKTEVDWVLKDAAENLDAIALTGVILLKRGDNAAALAEAEKALAINPGHLDSISLQASVYMDQKSYKIAAIKINKALEAKPDELTLNLLKLQIDTKSQNKLAIEQDYLALTKRFPAKLEFSYALAKFYANTQRDGEALELLQNVVEKNVEQLTPKLVLVDFLLQKDKQKAEATLNKFIKENSNESGLHFSLAKLYIQQQRFDEANVPLNWIVAHKEQEQEGLAAKTLLAKVAVQKGNISTASTMIKEVLAIDAKHYESLLLKARISLINGLYGEAIADLQGLLRDYYESDAAMVLLAQAYLKQEFPELAEKTFREALNLNPGNFSAVMPVVSRMIESKDLGRAQEVLQNALKINPDHAGALQALAQVRLLKKDWLGTQKIADLIAARPKGEGFSNYLSGKISQAQGLFEEAVEKYKLALSSAPTLSDALKSMIVCYEALKQRDKMFVFIDEFMQRNPSIAYPVIFKSQLYSLGKNWNEALAVLNKGIEQWPDVPQLYIAMSRIYIKNGERKEVIDTYKKGLEKSPNNVQLRMLLSSAYELQEDYDEAIQNYETIIAKHPNIDIAVNNLVSLLLDHAPGKENTERAIKLAKRFEKTEQPYFLDTYGWALLHNGRVEEAMLLFRQIVSKMPDVAVFQYHLGLSYHKIDDNVQAIEVLERALVIGAKQEKFVEKNRVEVLLEKLKAMPEIVEKI